MSNFALDQLFMHGHFVSPAALMASGLLEDKGSERPSTAPIRPAVEPARKHEAGRDNHLAHA